MERERERNMTDLETSRRIYTLKKVLSGTVTKSAHPARFSPDDKWSRQRVTLKKRFGLLLTQQSTSSHSPFFPRRRLPSPIPRLLTTH